MNFLSPDLSALCVPVCPLPALLPSYAKTPWILKDVIGPGGSRRRQRMGSGDGTSGRRPTE